MSQNQDVPTEDELREYINAKYSLRLERDALLRPNGELLVEICQKYLDDVYPPWRRKVNSDERPVWFWVFFYVKLIVEAHNKTYPIYLYDIRTPTRQRTRVILSILIFHQEYLQNIRDRLEEEQEELILQQKDYVEKKQELAKVKERIEKLAIRLSTSKPVDEMKKLIAEKERGLEQLKADCDEIGAKAKEVKTKNLADREVLENKTRENEALESELSELKKTLEILNDGSNIERKTADTERRITEEEEQLKQINSKILMAKKRGEEIKRRSNAQRLFEKEGTPIIDLIESRCRNFEKASAARRLAIEKHKTSILEHQKREESMRKKLANLELQIQELQLAAKTEKEKANIAVEATIGESRDRQRASIKEAEQLNKKIEEDTKARAELKLKTEQTLEDHKKYMERADKKVKILEDVYLKSKEQAEQCRPIIIERVNKINSLLGIVEPEMTMMEVPANRTYIKDPATNGQGFKGKENLHQ